MIGETILHYKILEKLGEGGMGVVYLAEDLNLERKVAIKFLPKQVAGSSEEKERFKIEAKAAAALNHSNIATIYSIEELDSEVFIVMEYIDGTELKDKIKLGSISVEEATKIVIQIAEGLEAAHKKGIVHRDIKSQNIMITGEGKVKIMDFGLAKMKENSQITKYGTTVGTTAYMSPEQARGEEVDYRADIWSFGVVLYEVLTRQLPFKGDYEAAVMYEILNEQPQSVEILRSDTPSELLHIIRKSMEKNPNERYQSISDLLIDLRRLKRDSSEKIQQVGGTEKKRTDLTGKRKRKLLSLITVGFSLILILAVVKFFLLPSDETINEKKLPIAVVDFVNQTNEPELDGLSGMLITALEQSRRLAVVTRSRMFDILNQMGKKDIDRIDESLGRQICQQADINAMAVASIRKFGKLYTIDLKVVDPYKNEYLFTAKEEAEGQESIPSMLDKLSEKTRIGLKERAVQVKETTQNIASVTTSNLEAYQHFFQGEQFINQLKFDRAIEEFKKAVSLDSTFAQAYYRLAYAENWQQQREGIQKDHLKQALKYINRLPEKERYLVKAQYAMGDRNFKAGIDILREMEQIYPDNKEMIYIIGDWSYHLGDYDTAIVYLNKTLEIDPNHQRALQHLTWTYRDMGNYDKMLETARRYVAVSSSVESYQLLGDTYTQLGQLEHGLTILKQARDLFPDNYRITNSIAEIYTYQGKYDKAEAELKKLIEENQPTETKQFGNHQLLEFYLYLGNYRKSINLLDKFIKLYLQENNTTHAMLEYLNKGRYLFWGWNDLDEAWKETAKTFPFKNKLIANRFYQAGLNLMQVYHGNYTEVKSITDSLIEIPSMKWRGFVLKSLIYSLMQDEKNAEIFADSVLQNIQSALAFTKILVLYPLAECQYERGHLNKALGSLKKLQTINVWALRPIYYPKSIYLMGKVYEKKGNTDNAIKSYEKFLELWKNADQDLPDLIDAKRRLTNLKGVS
jgi:serine/threonine protein kinase/tetratricopeptide (TPR) repeat protein